MVNPILSLEEQEKRILFEEKLIEETKNFWQKQINHQSSKLEKLRKLDFSLETEAEIEVCAEGLKALLGKAEFELRQIEKLKEKQKKLIFQKIAAKLKG